MTNYLKRLTQFQDSLEKEGVDAVLVEDLIDLYYFTGKKISLGQLWIGKDSAILFVDARYQEIVRKQDLFLVDLLSKESVCLFLEKNKINTVAFDGAKMRFAQVIEKKEMYPSLQWVAWNNLTRTSRVIKDETEIALLQTSAQLLWKGYRHIKGLLREGITEKEISCAFILFCLERGGEKVSFDPIIAFGENSAMPHYRAGNRKLKFGDIVLIDIGIEVNCYHSDMTRVVFFGKPDPLLEKWLKITQMAQNAALSLCRPGVKVGDLDNAARTVFAKHGVEEYFVHALGHGVGLEIHEFLRIHEGGVDTDILLEPGMVITVEPGLYKSGLGGVRYEDTIVITGQGHQNLTPLVE